jgi:hypothetical protein
LRPPRRAVARAPRGVCGAPPALAKRGAATTAASSTMDQHGPLPGRTCGLRVFPPRARRGPSAPCRRSASRP